jgi:EAL domain-containing protein (putative c-di-GMP-specific phosphodiesterase class I)
MYRAKGRQRGDHEVFDDEMRGEVLARLRTETELRRALDRDELRLHYQPIVEADSGRTVAVEALVRWEHPERGLVPPSEFIGVAEETGLISELGLWVLRTACAQVAEWQDRFDMALCVHVNVSGRQVTNHRFPAEVASIGRTSGLLPGTLGLEITESVLIDDAACARAVLDALVHQGVSLVLDDFGTGYSSLSHLKRFPLAALKVDRSFVAGLGTSADDSAIVEAILEMARTLGLEVTAEGVETEHQLEQLRRLGCGQAQGYLFSRPLAAEELEAHLAASGSACPTA